MKGHIRERSPGHWAIVLDVREPATGKRKRKWHSFRGTKRQAQIESARLISELQGGGYLEPTKTTFVQFLDQWLGHIKVHVSPRTHERYTEIIRKNIAPMLGAGQLTKLRPAQIAAAYSEALLDGRRDGSGGLSPNTVLYMHRLIKQALAHAVRWEMISRSPCPESGFMICGTPMLPTCSQAAFTQRSPASAWVTPRWGSRSTSTRMSSPACKPMPRPALTRPFE